MRREQRLLKIMFKLISCGIYGKPGKKEHKKGSKIRS